MDLKLPRGHNLNNEQKVVSYYLQNPSLAGDVPSKYFLHPYNQAIIESIVKLQDDGLQFDIDTILTYCKEKEGCEDLTYTTIKQLKENYDSFPNIEHDIQTLANDYIKFVANSEVLDNLVFKTTARGHLQEEAVEDFANRLLDNLSELKKRSSIYTTETASNEYWEIIQQRNDETRKRSCGYSDIDAIWTRPIAAGEISIWFGLKGSGKTAMVKAMENMMTFQKIPVFSVNPEMGLESIWDRMVAQRANLDMKEMQGPNFDQRVLSKIEQALFGPRGIKTDPYYILNFEPLLSLSDLEALIRKAIRIFTERNVFHEKEKFFVLTLDLLSMLSDLDEGDPRTIQKVMNQLSALAKRYRIHIMGVVQANENKLRAAGKMFKKPEEIDFYRPNLEDIYGGDAYAGRARFVCSLHRPRFMKERYFPDLKEKFDLEDDILRVHVIKQNDGNVGLVNLLYGENFKIVPFRPRVPQSADSSN